MSTEYYPPKPPITSFRASIGSSHTRVAIFVNRGKAGELVLRNEEWLEFQRLLVSDDPVVRTSFGGRGTGTVIHEEVPHLDPATTLLSECGEVLTVAQIRAQKGAGA